MFFSSLAIPGSFIVILLTLSSCNRSDYMSESELTRYVSQDDHLTKTSSSDQISLQVTYKPTDLLVAQELKNVTNPTVAQVNEARNKYKGHYYFILSFQRGNNEVLNSQLLGQSKFTELLETMSFKMGEFVDLTTSRNDSIPVADYVFNRTFGFSKSTDLLFVFDRTRAVDSEWIQINVDEFGLGMGDRSVRFNIRDLEMTPKIYTF
jgi:hypothetical protein